MNRTKLMRLLFWSSVVFLTGCASTSNYFSMGEKHLEKNEFDLAIQAFETAKTENPGDYKINREMGIAYYQKPQIDKAIPLLLEAFLADTTDGRTLFYLGTAFEIKGDLVHAMDMYRRYVDVNPAKDIRKSIEARLVGLIRKQMSVEAKAVLAQESAINPVFFPDSSIAVLYFKNMSKKRDLDAIQKGLADMLITDLSKAKGLKVVERIRMQRMLDELNMGKTGLVDESTAPRFGRLLGASKLVNGTFIDLSKELLRIDASFVHTKNEKTLSPSKVQGKLAQLFQMEKDLAFGILERLGISPTLEERDEIKIIPTENLLAFMAYCNGLDYEDKGMFKQAEQQYRHAAELDPHFSQAAEGANRAENLTLSEMPVSTLVEVYTQGSLPAETAAATPAPAQSTQDQESSEQIPESTTQTPATTETVPSVSTTESLPPAGMETPLMEQMMHTAGALDQGFLPGIDSRNPTREENQSSFGNAASFEIRVPIPAP